jgi:hypothetical protein
MPLNTRTDGSLVVPPPPVPMPIPESLPEVDRPTPGLPEWMNGPCGHIARAASLSVRTWGQLRYNFLAGMYEAGANGNVPVTPTAEDVAQALSREIGAPDEATKAALRLWVETIAAEAVAQIDQAKETVRQRAESRAEWARQRAEQDRVEAERQAIMDRSEWERQDVLAKEAEAAKWAAYEAQQAEHAAYKARTTAPTETNATC